MSGSLRPDMGFVSDEATAQSPLKEGGGVGTRTEGKWMLWHRKQ